MQSLKHTQYSFRGLKKILHPLEFELLKAGGYILGIDEVGRGSIAGPLVVGGVLIKSPAQLHLLKPFWRNIKDSKQMLEKRRNKIGKFLVANYPYWYIVSYTVDKIEEKPLSLLVSEASEKITEHFYRQAGFNRGIVVIDGLWSVRKPNIKYPNISVMRVKYADNLFFSVKLAALVAKYLRDYVMRKKYEKLFPKYRFKDNKGYATAFHIKQISKYGESRIHRKRFLHKISDRIRYGDDQAST